MLNLFGNKRFWWRPGWDTTLWLLHLHECSFFVHFLSGPDCLKTKMSELRLYCDLLVQQVQTIKSQHSDDPETPPTSEVFTHLFIIEWERGCGGKLVSHLSLCGMYCCSMSYIFLPSFCSGTCAGVSSQCHVCNVHQDSGGVYEPGQSESDPWPQTSREGNDWTSLDLIWLYYYPAHF